MLKSILFSGLILFLLGLVVYIVMAIKSQTMPDDLGLQNGLLRPCPDSPNCVCSEIHNKDDTQHYIAPLVASLDTVKAVIRQQGGEVVSENKDYIHAVFTTSIFRFVDDVELRFEPESGVTHIRSASRMGRSDFGVNRKRVETIKEAL